MLTEATQANLTRKAHWADNVQVVDGKPLFSWLDLSITELCNRSAGSPKACVFCPRIDASVYPNQNLHMPATLALKMGAELHRLGYEGAVVFCGYGEPLMHPMVEGIIAPFKGLHVEMVTNGDRLNPDRINKLYEAGVRHIVVSLYDGPHQLVHFSELFREAGRSEAEYSLRDRWYGPEADFGLKLTNRAGTVNAGYQPKAGSYRNCYYPAYQMSVDWNGDVLLCVQDWQKRLRFGNAQTNSLLECWRSLALHKVRMRVMRGDRSHPPCSSCNAEGTVHGAEHARVWES